jgi:hypothetical protein
MALSPPAVAPPSREPDSPALSLDDPAPPWRHNPSAWKQRVPICVLAAIAFVVACYMALYQWRLIDDVWDPVFGAQSRRVLDSDVSERMRRWFGIPDAALGAIAYLGDVIFGLAGSTRRWQFRPWMVLLFGLDVIPLGLVSAVLVFMQGTVVGSWCFLCLVTAVISLVLVVLSFDEVWSALVHLRGIRKQHRRWRPVWDAFWGRPPASVTANATPSSSLGCTWARDMEVALALWLAVSPFVLRHPAGSSSWIHDLGCASLLLVLALLSYGRRTRRAHLLELLLAAWLIGKGWMDAADAATAASQNHVIVGLVLAMLAIVPTEANRPPRGWRAA